MQTVIFGSTTRLSRSPYDLKGSIIDRFRLAADGALGSARRPHARRMPMRNLFVICLMILVGYAVDFRFEGGFLRRDRRDGASHCFRLRVLVVLALVGMLVKDPETRSYGLRPRSSPSSSPAPIFVSPATMPSWLQWLPSTSPCRRSQIVRGLSLGTATTSDVVSALLWIAAMLLIFAPLAARHAARAERATWQ